MLCFPHAGSGPCLLARLMTVKLFGVFRSSDRIMTIQSKTAAWSSVGPNASLSPNDNVGAHYSSICADLRSCKLPTLLQT